MIYKIFNYLLNNYFIFLIKKNPRILIGVNFKLRGKPIIDIKKGGQLIIGNNVYLNSKNKGYHIQMYAPVKLFIDNLNAKIYIGNNTRIHGSCIHAKKQIKIGNNCLIAANCSIIDSNGHELSFNNVENRINTIDEAKTIIINDNVWIGANSIILPGTEIGSGSVIGAGSIVKGVIESNSLYAGNPISLIKKFDK